MRDHRGQNLLLYLPTQIRFLIGDRQCRENVERLLQRAKFGRKLPRTSQNKLVSWHPCIVLFWVGRYNKTLNDWPLGKQWVSFPLDVRVRTTLNHISFVNFCDRCSVLWLFNVGTKLANSLSLVFMPVKVANEMFTAVGLRCRWNFQFDSFTSSFGLLRQNNELKSVLNFPAAFNLSSPTLFSDILVAVNSRPDNRVGNLFIYLSISFYFVHSITSLIRILFLLLNRDLFNFSLTDIWNTFSFGVSISILTVSLGLPRCKNLWHFFFVLLARSGVWLLFNGLWALLFSLFYVIREFDKFLHRGWATFRC